jgi:hypothetical protein
METVNDVHSIEASTSRRCISARALLKGMFFCEALQKELRWIEQIRSFRFECQFGGLRFAVQELRDT